MRGVPHAFLLCNIIALRFIKKEIFSYNLIVLLGVDCMSRIEPQRAVVLGEYILDTGATVRAAAKVFKISKSTVQTEVAIMKALFF